MVPTVLDLLDLEPPAKIRVTQSPLQGVSFAPPYDASAPAPITPSTSRCSATAPSTTTAGARSAPGPALVHGGCKILGQPIPAEKLSELDAKAWELYHIDADFAENHDIAEANRDTLIALIATWYVEAGKYDVMPVDGSGLARMIAEKPLVAVPRESYTYQPGTQSVPFFAAPRLMNRPHSITASVEIPEGGADGVLICQGCAAGGYSLFVKDGKLHYVHNWVGRGCTASTSEAECRPASTSCASSSSRRAGPTCLTARAHPAACNSTSTALWSRTRRRPRPRRSSSTPARELRRQSRFPVTPDYASPFKFTGTLHR